MRGHVQELDKIVRVLCHRVTRIAQAEKESAVHIATVEEAENLTRTLADANRPSAIAVTGIALSEEVNGTPVTAYYFEEAVMARIHKDLYGIGSWRDNTRRTIPAWETEWCGAVPYGIRNPGSRLDGLMSAEHEKIMCVQLVKGTGFDLLDHLDLDALRTDMLDPTKFDGEKIGEGSEADIFLYTIAGRQLVVKLYSPEKQHRMNEFARMFRSSFPIPKFIERIGMARRIIEEFRDWPQRQYVLSTLTEYAVSPKYIIMELGPRVTLRDLLVAAGLITAPAKDTAPSPDVAKELLDRFSASVANLQPVAFEIRQMQDLARIAVYGKHGLFRTCQLAPDFEPQNFLVRGLDPATGTFDLVLIDQGQKATNSACDPVFGPEELMHLRQAYERLMEEPRYRKYLEAHHIGYPDWPK